MDVFFVGKTVFKTYNMIQRVACRGISFLYGVHINDPSSMRSFLSLSLTLSPNPWKHCTHVNDLFLLHKFFALSQLKLFWHASKHNHNEKHNFTKTIMSVSSMTEL